MSVILKALKKLETDTIRKTDNPAWPDPVQTRRNETLRTRKSLRIKSMMLLAVALAAGFLGYWWIVRDGGPSSISPLIRTKMPNKPETTKGPDPKADDREPARPKTLPTVKSLDASAPSAMNLPIREQADERATPSLPSPGDAEKRTAGEIREKSKSGYPRNAAPVEKAGPPQISDRRITLQAIAWSEDSSRRFVVVNERILREQQTIDGITLVRIEKNGVCFRDGKMEWLQPFYGRQ